MLEVLIIFKQRLPNLQAEDVRKAFGRFSPESMKEIFLHHGKGIAPILYTKPRNGKVVKLFITRNTKEILDSLEFMLPKLEVAGIKPAQRIEIKNVELFECKKAPEIMEYSLRSVGIYAFLNRDIKYVDKLRFQQPDKLSTFVSDKLKEIINQRRYELGFERYDLSDLEFEFEGLKLFGHKFRGKIIPSFFAAKIKSNYFLPKFIGYKNGLGYGELDLIRN